MHVFLVKLLLNVVSLFCSALGKCAPKEKICANAQGCPRPRDGIWHAMLKFTDG